MHPKPHRVDQQPNPSGAVDSLILVQDGKVVCTISKHQSNSALSAARAICRASSGDVVVYETSGKFGDATPAMSASINSTWREVYRVTAISLRNA